MSVCNRMPVMPGSLGDAPPAWDKINMTKIYVALGLILSLMPILLASALSEMTVRKAVGGVLGLIPLVAIGVLVHEGCLDTPISYLYDHNLGVSLTIAGVMIYPSILAAMKLRDARRARTLDWPQSITVGTFEKNCAAYLRFQGWRIQGNTGAGGSVSFNAWHGKRRMVLICRPTPEVITPTLIKRLHGHKDMVIVSMQAASAEIAEICRDLKIFFILPADLAELRTIIQQREPLVRVQADRPTETASAWAILDTPTR